ncbi:MAG TPA: YncE family protein [Caulobacteraceae bacterium]
MATTRKANRVWTAIKLGAALIVVAILAVLALAVFPLAPRSAPELAFERFISLPGHGYLNVMDYVSIDGPRLFVTGESAGSVYKVDLSDASKPAVSELTGKPSAHGVAIDSKGIAFVTRSEADTVDAFDPTTLTRLASMQVKPDADAILYDPAVNLIYVANGDPRSATLIDPDKRAVVGTIALGGKPEFPVLNGKTGLVYQNLNDTNEVALVDVAARSVVARWSLAPCQGPTGLVFDAANQRLIAVCNKNARLVVFALDQHRVVATLPVGGGPDAVALDPSNRRIYVAGKDGKLTIVQQYGADNYRVLDNIDTHYGAHTLAVDPATHKVYVAYASLLIGPRLAVFQAR